MSDNITRELCGQLFRKSERKSEKKRKRNANSNKNMNQKRGRGSAAICSGDNFSSNTPSNTDIEYSKLEKLTAIFECPVCLEYILPPIWQCKGGHLVCSSCRPKLNNCPKCRRPLEDIRNLGMEQIADNLIFPCKHNETGCRMSLGPQEKTKHEEVCEFRPYSCPCPGASCSWQGQLEKVMVHLQHDHTNITTLNGEDIVFLATEINLPGAVDWVMMQSCFGHHFMLILEKQEKCDGHTQFFAIVQLIGSRKQAEHFAYRLELNGNRRRLTWEATPRSSHEGVSSAINESDCLVFDTSIAQLFADNGNLGINVTISENTDEKLPAVKAFDVHNDERGDEFKENKRILINTLCIARELQDTPIVP